MQRVLFQCIPTSIIEALHARHPSWSANLGFGINKIVIIDSMACYNTKAHIRSIRGDDVFRVITFSLNSYNMTHNEGLQGEVHTVLICADKR